MSCMGVKNPVLHQEIPDYNLVHLQLLILSHQKEEVHLHLLPELIVLL